MPGERGLSRNHPSPHPGALHPDSFGRFPDADLNPSRWGGGLLCGVCKTPQEVQFLRNNKNIDRLEKQSGELSVLIFPVIKAHHPRQSAVSRPGIFIYDTAVAMERGRKGKRGGGGGGRAPEGTGLTAMGERRSHGDIKPADISLKSNKAVCKTCFLIEGTFLPCGASIVRVKTVSVLKPSQVLPPPPLQISVWPRLSLRRC